MDWAVASGEPDDSEGPTGDPERLHAAVVTSNEAARRLYRSLGFAPYGLEPRGLACAGRYFDQELLILPLDRDD